MPDDAQTQTDLTDAINAVRQAQQGLVTASRNTQDQVTLLQINNEYQHLDSILNQMFNAQEAQDDVILGTATAALQGQAQSLQDDEATIEKIIGDAQLAAEIIGCVTKAATMLAAL